jgi:hypothetical protein
LNYHSPPLNADDHVAVARPDIGLFDLRADGGIHGLKRRLRALRGASADAKQRDQGEETAKRPPVKRHRLCNSSREDAATMQSS